MTTTPTPPRRRTRRTVALAAGVLGLGLATAPAVWAAPTADLRPADPPRMGVNVDNPVEVVVADIDANGYDDVIAVGDDQGNDSNVVVLEAQQEDGSFVSQRIGSVDRPGRSGSNRDPRAVAADIDGDGDLDVVVAMHYSRDDVAQHIFGYLAVLEQQADGTFTRSTLAPGRDADFLYDPSDVVVVDLDGDGVVELVTRQDVDLPLVWSRSPDGSWAWSRIPYPEVGDWQNVGLATADLDGDGDPEVVSIDESGVITAADLAADGTWTATVVKRLPLIGYDYYSDLVAADLDADGDVELATMSPGVVTVLDRGADGAYTATTAPYPSGYLYYAALRAGNADGDADLELVALLPNPYTGSANLVVLDRGADGAYAATSVSATGRFLALGDLNGDAIVDAVTADVYGYSVAVFSSGLRRVVVPVPGLSNLAAPGRGIAGSAVGDVLLATTGETEPGGATLTHQWFRRTGAASPVPIPGATGATYTLTAADVGSTVEVVVSGALDGHPTGRRTSAATGAVVAVPVARDDAYAVLVDGALEVGAAAGVLANDTDADTANGDLAAALASGPGHGDLALRGDGSFAYVPTRGWSGTDSFTYTATDGTTTSSAATVTVTVGTAPPAVMPPVTPVQQPGRAPTVELGAAAACQAVGATVTIITDDPDTAPADVVVTAVTTGAPATAELTRLTGGRHQLALTAPRAGVTTVTVTVSDGTSSTTMVLRVLVGTRHSDALLGGAGTDVLLGLGGADRIIGSGGDDVLCGGTGADVLRGWSGSDRLDGGDGDDFLRGGTGADVLRGGSGDDRVVGGPGADSVVETASGDVTRP